MARWKTLKDDTFLLNLKSVHHVCTIQITQRTVDNVFILVSLFKRFFPLDDICYQMLCNISLSVIGSQTFGLIGDLLAGQLVWECLLVCQLEVPIVLSILDSTCSKKKASI